MIILDRESEHVADPDESLNEQPDEEPNIQAFLHWADPEQLPLDDKWVNGVIYSSDEKAHVDCKYIPQSALKEYFTKDRIIRLWQELFRGRSRPSDDEIHSIQTRYLKGFAILLRISKGRFIKPFLNRTSVEDQHLPFENRPSGFPRTSGRHHDFFALFQQKQHIFCAPTIEVRSHLEWPAEFILPITRKRKLPRGGSSTTYEIEIHEAHHKLHKPRKSFERYENDPCPNTFVLKTYNLRDGRVHFENEKNGFLHMRATGKPVASLIGFFTSFEHGNTFNIILEFANGGTLEEYFEAQQPPYWSQDILALWRNLFMITNALSRVHEVKPGDPNGNILKGWHQDVKPKNILVSTRNQKTIYECEFKLADLGLSHFKKKVGENQQDGDVRGTRTYGAPECYRFDQFVDNSTIPVTSTVDVWSLGCVFSEVATWIVRGYDGLKEYRESRWNTMVAKDEKFRDPGCFHDGRKVSDLVKEHHEEMRQEICAAAAMIKNNVTLSVLDMVDDMLLPHSTRQSALSFCRDGGDILEKAENELKALSLEPIVSDVPGTPDQTTSDPLTRSAASNLESSSPLSSPGMNFSPSSTPNPTTNGRHVRGITDPPRVEGSSFNDLIPSGFTEFERSVTLPPAGNDIPYMSVQEAITHRKEMKVDKQSREAQLKYSYLLEKLKGRDHIFVLDDSASMNPHWDKVVELLQALTYLVKTKDDDGLELAFTIKSQKYKSKKTTPLVGNARSSRPPARPDNRRSDMEGCLSSILEPYLNEIRNTSAPLRKLHILVFSNGLWQPQNDASQPIKDLIRTLEENRMPANQAGIQFISFGSDLEGIQILEYLDRMGLEENLGRDIVDHEPSNGNVYKMLLGATNKWFDDDVNN